MNSTDPNGKGRLAAACAIGLLAWGDSAAAEPVPYAGLSAVYSFVDDSNFKDAGVVIGARATLGVDLSPYFGAELHGAVGITSDKVVLKNPDDKVEVKLKDYAALYGKANWPIDPSTNVYALLGYARIKADVSGSGSGESSSGGDPSYGLGFDVKIAQNARFMIDGIVLHDSGSLEVLALSAGVRWDFR